MGSNFTDYYVLETDDIMELVIQVNSYKRKGWNVLGGVCAFSVNENESTGLGGEAKLRRRYLQAMIKEPESPFEVD